MDDGLWLFIVMGGMGVWYTVYSIVYRSKITLYTRYNIQKYHIHNEYLFLKMQLYTGIINGIVVLCASIGCYLYQSSTPKVNAYPFVCLVPFVFHMINHTFIYFTERKGYIVKKN